MSGRQFVTQSGGDQDLARADTLTVVEASFEPR
jgi:hypothetical protein